MNILLQPVLIVASTAMVFIPPSMAELTSKHINQIPPILSALWRCDTVLGTEKSILQDPDLEKVRGNLHKGSLGPLTVGETVISIFKDIYYGYWCGPGYSGGLGTNGLNRPLKTITSLLINPEDSLDDACKIHDLDYDTAFWNGKNDVQAIMDNQLLTKSKKQEMVNRIVQRVNQSYRDADLRLGNTALSLNPDPGRWTRRPVIPAGTNQRDYYTSVRAYRSGVIDIFINQRSSGLRKVPRVTARNLGWPK